MQDLKKFYEIFNMGVATNIHMSPSNIAIPTKLCGNISLCSVKKLADFLPKISEDGEVCL